MVSSPIHSIVEQLMRGDASCLTQDVIFNINQIVIALINKEPLTKVEQDTIDDILHISNLIYNNTDRSILVLEDGVYDLLLVKYKKYNPNYRVGAEPITIGNFGTADVVNDISDDTNKLFVQLPYVDMTNMMFKDELSHRDFFGNAIINSNVKTVSKRLRDTSHLYPQLVGTLEKAKFTLDAEAAQHDALNDDKVQIFERDFLRKHVEAGIVNPYHIELVLELKYDGVSIEAEVTDTVLSARTRGDTQLDKASDLTPILKGYKFPRASGYDIKPFGMNFEAVISHMNLAEIAREFGKKYINPRNAVIGILGNGDAAKFIKYITLVPLKTSHDNMTREEEILFMNKYYSTGEFMRYAIVRGTYNEVLFQVKKFVDEAEACRPAMPYLYDGVVVSYLDPTIRKTLGRNNHINQYSIAIKFNTKKKLTRCRGVSFTIGANGDITPMIHYDPIEFYGAINTKSSLHSYSRFRELGLKPNDIIEVEYVNDVMAYVSKAQVEENMYNPLRPFEFMRQCPECGRPIVISESGDNATCTNMACPGRTVARVTNMLSKLGFKGFSEAAVRSLNLTSFKDLMTLQEDRAAVLGPTNQKTLIAAIEKLYESNVPDFMLLGSLGFTNIASGKWKAILKKIPLADIITASDVELMFKIDSSGKGIGEKTARTIVTERKFFMKDLEYIYRMPNVVITKGDNTRDITFSKVIRFSGVRDSDIMNQLTFEGHDCSEGAVTKNTDYLIIPFVGYTSGKVTKAEEYNAKSTSHKIKILTLDEFKLNMSTYLMS